MKRFFLWLVTFAILISACGPGASIAKSNLWRETKPQVSDADLTTLVSGNNTFALDLYKSLSSREGNLVISPYSISTVFAMTYAGARGETASQIASTFHFDLPDDRLHPALNALDLALTEATRVKLLREMDKDRNPPQINIINTVWAQQGFPFQTPFLDTLGANYGAGVHLADFASQPETARENINGLVRKETKDKIEELIPENALGPDTSLVLVNALYFASDWQERFDYVENSHFYLQDGSRINVPTMNLGECFPYAEGENWVAIELPYLGDTFAMDIIVPNAGDFEAFEENLDYLLVSKIISSMEGAAVSLTLPKFEFASDFALSDTLQALGVSDAFGGGSADFSGMTGSRNLFLGESFHKAYIAVDEEGTCAAAATESHFILISSCTNGTYIPVQIDRPFIFLIRELKSGQFLFIGRVLDPRQ